MKLESLSAFAPGSDLWIIPNRQASRWSEIIDWQTGFLLSRALAHSPLQPHESLKDIVTSCNIPIENLSQGADSPLLIGTNNYLPNKTTVMVGETNNPKIWLKKVATVWANLNFPTLRIFLPKGLETDEFSKIWSSPEISQEITIVADSAAPGL